MKLLVQKPSLHGSLTIPPSKSHTVRALLCAALARGTSYITAPLISGDIESALCACRKLGVTVCTIKNDAVKANSVCLKIIPPKGGLFHRLQHKKPLVLNLGNSGSLLYFLSVLLSAASVPFCVTGDESLITRPLEPLLAIYRQAGRSVQYTPTQRQRGSAYPSSVMYAAAPLSVCGPLAAGTFELEGPFSQPVSGLLLTAPLLTGTTRIIYRRRGEVPYLFMTCGWLKKAGVTVTAAADGSFFEIQGRQYYHAFSATITGDWSSAAFPLVAAVACKAPLTLYNLTDDNMQGDIRIVTILINMGACISYDVKNSSVHVHPRLAILKGITYNCADIPDVVPALSAAACFAEGETLLTGIGVCRSKECDRIHAVVEELTKFGAEIAEGPDFLRIIGKGGRNLHAAQVHSHHDHRIAMMLAVAALGIAANSPYTHAVSCIDDFECTAISYPRFIESFNNAGACFVAVQ